ncbi:MAG: 3'-5' exonuclease [Armatimonadota bacterium]|nr:ribonuclease H-like domain-containing protein [bacterium]
MTSTDEILFGYDHTQGIVAVEVGPETATIYRRVDGAMTTQDEPFKRWILATERHDLADSEWTELDGEDYRFLAEFPNEKTYNSARYVLRDAHAAHIAYPTAAKQYLARTGRTLFKGMAFDDVVRMQLDIETLGLYPDRSENEIFMVAIKDNRGFETIITGDESKILKETVAILRERDPDVIEGHNIYDFDLTYLVARAKYRGIRLAFGRDGSEVTFGAKQQCAIGYYSRPFTPAHIHGRHVIDTLLSVQRWDISRASLSSYSLKSVARAFGIAEDDREIIPHDQIAREWKTNPDRVRKYCLQDVRETDLLAGIVCPYEFYLAQMVPDTYGHGATSGTGEKINSIFIRHYLKRGCAIPEQSEQKSLPGGYTEVRNTGVIEHIVKCDVESLYPSIMLTKKIKPKSDTLDMFLPALADLVQRRLSAKRKAKETHSREHDYWDGLQSAFKILINSFYGYLAGPFNFNDYEAAARVTTTGQKLVKLIVEELEKTGSLVVEVDTDGVYFRPPDGIDSEQDEVNYIERIGSALPEGIRLAHDGRYKAMISLKIKNYVVESYDGKKTFRGSALRSRSDEPFGRDFITNAAEYLLHGEKDKVHALYQSIAQKINDGQLGVDEFARRERITEKTLHSAGKKRLAQAVGKDAKVGEYVSIYQKNDGAIGLAKNYSHDEDRHHLLDKLYKFANRLREAFGDDFDSMFPKPSAKTRSETAGQQSLGLFD